MGLIALPVAGLGRHPQPAPDRPGQRWHNWLPWLVFSLPAGVITDRVDRRVTMVVCDTLRAGLTVVVALCRPRRPGQPARRRPAGLRAHHPSQPSTACC